MDKNIVMTDLKPENTLYDLDQRKVTIIDLGGSVRIEAPDTLKHFRINNYVYTFTSGFCAPEMDINVNKKLIYGDPDYE